MTHAEFYQDLLALPGLQVTDIETKPQRIIIHARIEPRPTPCPVCHEPTAICNQYDARKVQDLAISGKQVWLHLRIPQLVCLTCTRYFNATPEWIMPGKSYTRRQAKWIFELCARQPFTEVAALVGLSHKTVERLYYACAREAIDLPARYARVRRIGIDEVAHQKGGRAYVCVLTDLDRGVQLDVLPDRKKATLMAHFEALGPDFCAQIEVVSCDMWRPYKAVAETCFPQATLVVDHFHIVRALNDVLDGLRKRLRRVDRKAACYKGIKWLLLKRPEELSALERARVGLALESSWLLAEVYRLRNTFHALFTLARRRRGRQTGVEARAWLARELRQWLAHADQLGDRLMSWFTGMLDRWFDQVVAYAQVGLSNAVTEGLNNFLRYFQRISFGMPKFEHIRLRILMATA